MEVHDTNLTKMLVVEDDTELEENCWGQNKQRILFQYMVTSLGMQLQASPWILCAFYHRQLFNVFLNTGKQ